MLRTFLALCLISFMGIAHAQDIVLNEEQEQRARVLFKELRCVVCQNQSIDSSDADVAKDLRAIVREQIADGRSNADVRSHLVERYGEFILLKPSFSWHTAILWFSPVLLLILGGWLAVRALRGQKSTSDAPLTKEEEDRIAEILQRRDS